MGDINDRELDKYITRGPDEIEDMDKEELWDVIDGLNEMITSKDLKISQLQKAVDDLPGEVLAEGYVTQGQLNGFKKSIKTKPDDTIFHDGSEYFYSHNQHIKIIKEGE